MSSNSTLNYVFGAVLGVAVGLFVAPAIPFLAGHAMAAGFATFAISSSLLNARFAAPASPLQKPPDYRNSGRVFNGGEAAAKTVEMNSASEAVVIPVVFGTVRIGGNHVRYDKATFRSVPIIERLQRSREAVAYELARDTFRTEPAVVDHAINVESKKRNGGGGKGGGKSGGKGGGKSAPPSQRYSDTEKVNQYTSILLADDETGKQRLPKEFDERTVGYKYYLTWELAVCMGEVSKLHAIRVYPGEDLVVERFETPEIVADDTVLSGEGGGQGGTIRFYRGSATQTRNVADPYAEDYTNYRHVAFAMFDDYWMGNSPSPQSYAFEVERIPVCLDGDGDPIPELQTRAGIDTVPVAVQAADWNASEITVDATGHGAEVGDVVFLAGFEPAAYNGSYTVTAADADSWTADWMIEPETVTTFGYVQGPPTEDPVAISAATWAAGEAEFTATGHGLIVDQEFTVSGVTPAGYNGTWVVKTREDDDHVTAEMADPGGSGSSFGELQAIPLPVKITSASWEDNVATFGVAGDHGLNPAESVEIYGFEPTEWNITGTVLATPSASGFTMTLEIDPGPVTTLGTSKVRPDASYGDANPAAILYELLTNKLWGLGLEVDKLDIPSFVQASEYFFAQRIGMSFAMESQSSAADAVEMVRSHVNTALLWVGDKLYCRCILDRDVAYSPRFILDSDNVSDVQIVRPAWTAAINELRGTFANRHNNYQAEIVQAHDDASIQSIGRTHSQAINFPAFSNRDVTEKTVQRMLFEMSYPAAILKFKMNRANSDLYPTAFLEFRWNEASADPVTTYWRVVEVSDADTEGGTINVTATEEPYATPIEGTSDTFEEPVPGYEGMPRTTDADLDFSDQTQTLEFGDISILFGEMPITLTDADRIFCVFASKPDGFLHGLRFFWKLPDGEDYSPIGDVSPWAITGKIVDDFPEGLITTRDGVLEIQLDKPEDRARFLTYCSLSPTAADDIDRVSGAETNWLFLDGEFIQVSQAEPGSQDNRVRLTAYIRAQYGSEMKAHAAGTKCAFVYEFVPRDHTLRYDQIPLDTLLDIRCIPTDRRGLTGDAIDFQHTFTGEARKALRIERIDTWWYSGSYIRFRYRPRWHTRGAEIVSDLEGELELLAGDVPDGYETYVMPLTSAGIPILAKPVKVTHTYDDTEDGNDPYQGWLRHSGDGYAFPVGTTTILFYQVYNGVLGLPVESTPAASAPSP